MLRKVFLTLSVIVSSIAADSVPIGPHYKKVSPPKPFAYKYGVVDEYTGTNFDHSEQQDEYGVVSGEYRVNLPDSRVQIVTYRADHDGGYVAHVRYEGKAVYPPAPPPKKYNKRKAVHHSKKFKASKKHVTF